ncbi:MAG: M14 family metallopeptidase, partial [SAR202 cluster bacterium]|nr:M14 family metallopeptidase [SAR202 cluster bacterium]
MPSPIYVEWGSVSSESSNPGGPKVTTPSDFLGFAVGDDYRLADWPQVAEYMHLLDRESDRVRTVEIGRSTEGNPFLLTFISSSANIADLESHRETQQRLSDPENISGDEADALIADARAVVAITCSIHATEVGGTQMSVELAHRLASDESPRIRRMLDNVILILVPSLNPDGLIKVKRWYDGTRDTHYEGSIPPYLYHKYTGHDNNRDWFMFTQAETRLVVEHVHNQWRPHITYDIHQTRSDGMRMILPPFVDPVGPNVDPVLQSELAALGTQMASELTAAGKQGVAVNVVYDSYSPSRSYPHYHGGIRVLSEAASVRIASPIKIDRTQLKSDRGERPNVKSWNHTMPWSGGQWRLRDIVEYDLIASLACLDSAARNRDTWVRNSFDVLRRSVTHQGNPYGFVIPREQHDPGAARELLDVLKFAQVQVHALTEDSEHEGLSLKSGDNLVLTLQRFGTFAQTMLETQTYPDIRPYPGGPPKHPYDSTAHSLPLTMGVTAYELKKPIDPLPRLIEQNDAMSKGVKREFLEGTSYVIDPKSNESVKTVNRLLAAGVEVSRTSRTLSGGDSVLPAGAFVVELNPQAKDLLRDASGPGYVGIASIDRVPEADTKRLRTPRIGVYQSYVPSTEEGWTRFVLDEYGFQHEPVWDWGIRETDLARRFDVIIVPHQAV